MLVIIALVVSGCAASSTRHYETFHDVQLRSILVVPPLNEVTDVQATTSVLATLPFFLAEKGYYVFPVNTVKTLLEFEGYYEPAEVHAAPPEQLANLFKADAVLYVTIHEWTSKYIVLATSTQVDFGYRLVAADGSLLWEKRSRAHYTPSNSSGGGLALMLNAIQAAVERASPTYIPLTRSVHSQALLGEGSGNRGIPPGPYHPGHEAYLTSEGLPTAR
ncbi:DUF799 domain-containing protein [Marinospirillum sp.]|uniref:DUF799 domain-containing protein n=1 Tax=Marinospirillum sp. TaxID=2183934 RepID=UPI00384DDB71